VEFGVTFDYLPPPYIIVVAGKFAAIFFLCVGKTLLS